MKAKQRQFIRKLLALSSLAAVGCSSYSWLEANRPQVDQVTVPLDKLPAALEGFKIIQMSDFHLYPYTQLALVEKVVKLTNSRQPDLVALTGDFVWHQAEAIFDLAPVLSGLNPKYGLFSVLGNHDVESSRQVVRQGLREAGLPVLHNEGLTLTVGNSQLYIAGLDDAWHGRPDLKAALNGNSSTRPTILLMHEPDFVDNYARLGGVSLQLSGHSHGGQIRLPGVGALALPPMGQKYDQGLYQVNQTWLYTTRGVGMSILPLRFNCPPEITEITLVGR